MATYASLLTLEKEVKKKSEKKPTIKSDTMNKNKGNKRSRSRTPPRQYQIKKPASKKVPKAAIHIDFDIPDRQYGDLYCQPCDSHMNSEQMWEAHIQGKRHLRTVKKGEIADLRYDYVDEDPIMIKQLEDETRPIVGLQHIVEIQRLEQRPMYQCFLCSGNVPTPELLLEHIAGTKHRLAYLREHHPEGYELIKSSNLKKGHIEPVVEEYIQKHEKDEGRGKMLVKREKEATGFEKEKGYNFDYVQSRPPKSKIYKPQPPKGKSFKKKDLDSLPESTNKSYRNKDWDCGRSTHSDRSYDSYADDSNRGPLKDRELDCYKRSPDRFESHNRSGYPSRRSPNLPSPDNDYRRMEKNRLGDDRYGYPRHTPDKERHGSLKASEYDRYHETDIPLHRPRSAADDRYSDLREVLKKKKASVDPYLRETNTNSLLDKHNLAASRNLSSFTIGRGISTLNAHLDMPDEYLRAINLMTPTEFLQLAYFKVKRLEITTESELKLLDKLSSTITALSMEIKANQLPIKLQDQFKETMVKSGIAFNPHFAKDLEEMIQMVGKTSSNLDSSHNYPNAALSQPVYSTPTFVSSEMANSSSGIQHSNNQDYTSQTTNRNLWQHVDSSASPSFNSTTFGSSSSSSYIPGLTYTDNQLNENTNSNTSPFDLLANYTKDLLGGTRSKTDTHRF